MRDPCLCYDCGINVNRIKEWYMVENHIWDFPEASLDITFLLCIGCLETRIGRRLVPMDFDTCDGNASWPFSARLIDRMGDDMAERVYRAHYAPMKKYEDANPGD